MIRLFLENYNKIQEMTEKEFIDWFRERVQECCMDIWTHKVDVSKIKLFDVKKL